MSNANATNVSYIVIKASAGTLYRLRGFCPWRNKYVHVFDKASQPTVSTDSSLFVVPVRDGYFDIDFGANGRDFSNGIAAAISGDWTPLYTYDGYGGITFDAQYT